MQQTQTNGGDKLLRRYEYDDRWIVAADLGVHDETVVDTVGDTAIVVPADGSQELEVTLPGAASDTAVNNGIVTVEGDK
ncbi:MAG: hypothetical protein A07HR60_02693 [uncultured archaeon A07HR60]|jgi:hypothetical protein|nr:MAG: hypothetical protein J07HR59_00776 [Halorubrum sp. J07HR59]ESS10677.1 MAG: hypothetical protein A07HR60_02693 [uncultured archaeon A07HR60]